MDNIQNELQFAGQLIPNYLMTTEDTEANVFETSFVSAPATDRGFLMFSRDESAVNKLAPKNQNFTILKDENFKILDKSKVDSTEFQRMTSGVWMMPNTKYIRQTESGELYTVEFTAETLKAALLKYLKSGFANLVKSEHSGEYLDGFVAMEHWIIEDENTLSPIFQLSLADLGYKASDIPKGTVMKTTFVADEQFWQEKILTGMVKGYSIGGLFNLTPLDAKQQSFRKEGFPEVTKELEQKVESVAEEFQTVEVKVEIEVCDEKKEEESMNEYLNEDAKDLANNQELNLESDSVMQDTPSVDIIVSESIKNEQFANVLEQMKQELLKEMQKNKEEFKSQLDSVLKENNELKDKLKDTVETKEELQKKVLDQPIKSNFNANQANNKPANQEDFVTLNGKRIKIPK